MRIFSILAAAVVMLLLAIFILARPELPAAVRGQPDPEAAESAPADTAQAEDKKMVKVMVRKVTGQQVDSAVVLRGQTEAARQVDVRSETSAVVVSEPLRKGARISEGEAMCVLDAGTRQAMVEEWRARLKEAESRVPEAQARVEEARARLEEAQINQNAAARLIQDGFASQTRVATADANVAAAEAGVTSASSGLRAALSGIESARASLNGAEKEIERLTITAPFDGLLESDTAE